MFLITSASMIDRELQSEFGAIPPVFLPVGNRPLYEHQLQTLPEQERVVLTLPQGYQIGELDRRYLEQKGVELLWLPQGLKLGESVMYALNLTNLAEGEPLYLLHGDTLIQDLPTGSNLIGISEVEDAYDWAVFRQGQKPLLQVGEGESLREWVANGYFAFAQPRQLIRLLIENQFDFIGAINAYHEVCPLGAARVSQWLDFGHTHTYYRSKTAMTTQRAFNHMEITSQVVTKRSAKGEKMMAEAHWFRSLPAELKVFTPQLLSVTEPGEDHLGGYQIEYKHLTALNELFVFGQLPPFVWRRILAACLRFVDACRHHLPAEGQPVATLDNLLSGKTVGRLRSWQEQSGLSVDRSWYLNGTELPSLSEILKGIEPLLSKDTESSWYHGDLCFSNILYDFRTSNIKVIDPRGLTAEGELSPFGDAHYDLAKLSHSVIGRYDSIIAGYFQLDWQPYQIGFSLESSSRLDAIEHYFCQLMKQRYGLDRPQLIAMQIHLFLSMLPLHADKERRQQALLANALRLYTQLDELS